MLKLDILMVMSDAYDQPMTTRDVTGESRRILTRSR